MKNAQTEFRITDYDDIDYEADFWTEREYENEVEQHVIRALVDHPFQRFLDLGAGFGRLVGAYRDRVTDQVVLFDYSKKLLEKARKRFAKDQVIDTRQGSFYELPFDDEYFDGGVSVRVLHHVEDVPSFLKELNRVLKKDAEFILEFANKRNLLEIFRRISRRTKFHPFSRDPENRSEKGLTINFHPAYVIELLAQHGFRIETKVSSSLFRSDWLKKRIGQRRLSKLESMVPLRLRRFCLSPSVFLKIRKIK